VDDVDATTEIDEASSLTFSPQACAQFSEAVYTDIWESLEFETLHQHPVASTAVAQGINGVYGIPPQPGPTPMAEQHILDGSDLASLLSGTLSLGVLAEADMKSRLRSAVQVAGRDACNHTLLPFVKLVFEQKVECLKLDPHSNRASDEDKNLVTAMLIRFIVASVGTEPTPPRSWSQPMRGCRLSSCSDCSRVNEFLAAPDRQVAQFPVGKDRRHHLHVFFTDKLGANYSVTTLRHSNPNIWQITKNASKDQTDHDTWKTRKDEAKKRILELVKTGPFQSLRPAKCSYCDHRCRRRQVNWRATSNWSLTSPTVQRKRSSRCPFQATGSRRSRLTRTAQESEARYRQRGRNHEDKAWTRRGH
jgi:hypothetical protein